MERGGTTVATTDRRGWCVLLCRSPEGDLAPPKELLDTLARKGLLVCLCRTAFDAMTELVIHERALREGGRRQPMVLMVVEPDDMPLCGELLRAAEKYAPHAACWQYSATLKPKVQALRAAKESISTHQKVESRPPSPPPGRGSISSSAPANGPASARSATPTRNPSGGFEEIVKQARSSAGSQSEPERPSSGPRLKLAWGPAPPRPAPKPTPQPKQQPPPPSDDRPSYIDEEIEVTAPRPLDAKPFEARPAPSRRSLEDDQLPAAAQSVAGQPPPLLSDEELAILLWDTWYPERPGY